MSGEVDGSRYVLDAASGKVLDFAANDGPPLGTVDLRGLSELSARVATVYGGPQDVEWAIEDDGRVWLLQSRPVTTEITGVPRGPIYGPGPVAETFPFPLTQLEAICGCRRCATPCAAVMLAGTATTSDVAASDVVVCVEGHVAIDSVSPVRSARR